MSRCHTCAHSSSKCLVADMQPNLAALYDPLQPLTMEVCSNTAETQRIHNLDKAKVKHRART